MGGAWATVFRGLLRSGGRGPASTGAADAVAEPMDAAAQAARLVGKIAVLKSNPHYRVADVVYNRGYRHVDSGEKVLELPEFEGTILRDYLLANGGPGRPFDLALMSDLIERAIASGRFRLPEPDVLAIHLRAGDYIQHPTCLAGDYESAIRRHPGARRCRIVTCFAFQEFAERQWWMFSEEKLAQNVRAMTALLERLIAAFPEIEFDVASSTDIDQDFVYMVAARWFIRDEGGFSELVEALRAHRAGANAAEPAAARA